MTTTARIHAILAALRDGKITADEARTRNAALKTELGPQYEPARRMALVQIAKGK